MLRLSTIAFAVFVAIHLLYVAFGGLLARDLADTVSTCQEDIAAFAQARADKQIATFVPSAQCRKMQTRARMVQAVITERR